jgi:hypothetical protein
MCELACWCITGHQLLLVACHAAAVRLLCFTHTVSPAALQLVAGLLKLAPEEAQGKLRGEGGAAQHEAAEEFRKMYDPYDWTKALQ